jgi:hypothetical protein
MLYAALVSDDLSQPGSYAGPAAAHPASDPAARCLLRKAQGAFQKWPEGFAGFRASVACETPRGLIAGQVTVGPPDRVDVTCDDLDLRACLRDMLWGIMVDRTPRFFDEGDGRFPISFGDGRDEALGRPVNVDARLGQLRYWIDGSARIRQVECIARGLRVLTTFDAFARTTPGRILPAQATTRTWDLASGALLRSESVHDSHRRIEHVWLPSARRISGNPGRTPVVISLDEHELL